MRITSQVSDRISFRQVSSQSISISYIAIMQIKFEFKEFEIFQLTSILIKQLPKNTQSYDSADYIDKKIH